MPEREPQLGDEVKHKNQKEYIGKVIAKYPESVGSTKMVLDIRLSNDKIYYASPAVNWTTTRKVEDIE